MTWGGTLTAMRASLPERKWDTMTPEVYATFWTLRINDIYLPQQRCVCGGVMASICRIVAGHQRRPLLVGAVPPPLGLNC